MIHARKVGAGAPVFASDGSALAWVAKTAGGEVALRDCA